MLESTSRIVGALGALAVVIAAASPVHAEDATPDAKASWTKNCASCHGEDGKAKTKMGEVLKVRDLTDPAVHATLTREGVIKATKEGVKNEAGKQVMKGYAGKLSDAEIEALADHVMSLK
jgi:cytochrome c553